MRRPVVAHVGPCRGLLGTRRIDVVDGGAVVFGLEVQRPRRLRERAETLVNEGLHLLVCRIGHGCTPYDFLTLSTSVAFVVVVHDSTLNPNVSPAETLVVQPVSVVSCEPLADDNVG